MGSIQKARVPATGRTRPNQAKASPSERPCDETQGILRRPNAIRERCTLSFPRTISHGHQQRRIHALPMTGLVGWAVTAQILGALAIRSFQVAELIR